MFGGDICTKLSLWERYLGLFTGYRALAVWLLKLQQHTWSPDLQTWLKSPNSEWDPDAGRHVLSMWSGQDPSSPQWSSLHLQTWLGKSKAMACNNCLVSGSHTTGSKDLTEAGESLYLILWSKHHFKGWSVSQRESWETQNFRLEELAEGGITSEGLARACRWKWHSWLFTETLSMSPGHKPV